MLRAALRCAQAAAPRASLRLALPLSRAASSSSSSAAASSSSSADTAAAAASVVAAAVRGAGRPLVLFGRSYCRVCRDVAERLDDGTAAGSLADLALDRPLAPAALGGAADVAALRAALAAATGQEHTPYLFVGGAFVETGAALSGLRRGATDADCALRPQLERAGVVVTGPFRA